MFYHIQVHLLDHCIHLLICLNFENDRIILKLTSKKYYGPAAFVDLGSRQGPVAGCFGHSDERFGS
jgi:hypothetical protein